MINVMAFFFLTPYNCGVNLNWAIFEFELYSTYEYTKTQLDKGRDIRGI